MDTASTGGVEMCQYVARSNNETGIQAVLDNIDWTPETVDNRLRDDFTMIEQRTLVNILSYGFMRL